MCILVVDDEPLIRMLLSEELAHEGWEVAEAVDGDSAAAMILEPPCRFSMVITDVQMPGALDGLALARLTRARLPHIPIILTTGRPEALKPIGPRRPNEAVILKPFLPSELVPVVRRLMALNAGTGERAPA